jgi:hypothetical protein
MRRPAWSLLKRAIMWEGEEVYVWHVTEHPQTNDVSLHILPTTRSGNLPRMDRLAAIEVVR